MIDWSDEVRSREPGYFCKAACDKGFSITCFSNSYNRFYVAALLKQIWIVSDVRRKTDVEWFKETYGEKVKLVRIFAEENVRKARGWKFTEGMSK